MEPLGGFVLYSYLFLACWSGTIVSAVKNRSLLAAALFIFASISLVRAEIVFVEQILRILP